MSDRRDLLTFEAPVRTTSDVTGEPVTTWIMHCLAWAPVKPLRGSEHSLAEVHQLQAEVLYRVRPVANPDTKAITAGMRIVWGARTLYISAVLTSSNPREVDLLAQERPPA